MRKSPYTLIFTAMVSLIFIFGYAMMICEGPLSRNSDFMNFSLFSNSMWNVIITMTTVGYGDFYARTDLGRFMIFLVCIFGIFVLSMMMVTLSDSLKTTSLEGKAITVLQRLELRQDLIEQAAYVITIMAKVCLKWK